MQQLAEQAAAVRSLSSSTNPNYGLNNLQLNHFNDDLDFLNHLAWDQAAASHFDVLDPTSAAAAVGDLSSLFAPELDFNLSSCLNSVNSFGSPLLDSFPPSGSVPYLSPANTSLTNTPVTAILPSPSPVSPTPDGSDLLPGLKLPAQKATRPSKPGRRPAGASLLRTTDGRIAKRTAATTSSSVSADDHHQDVDVDPEIIDRRQRNNMAAKRYRQKKIDRIQELEEQVKEVTQERDDLRIRLARQEAEIAALREMLKMQQSKSEGSKG
ncbi:hypothetical protein N657DRAFT_679959 [Parathielavia appendiculata]|uniref:BZIP domain-containing protein n=1 Tax=Parathielavia appendiculata TaxID=2587402 RepID=A0AAN6U2C6_9PEZI|nr:hypothetical protein N657DRAFT_679959 [Parathielavia appendiculata]